MNTLYSNDQIKHVKKLFLEFYRLKSLYSELCIERHLLISENSQFYLIHGFQR